MLSTTPSHPTEGVDRFGSLPVRFDQRFQVWRYVLGHSELELRSTDRHVKGHDFVAIRFFGVLGMKLARSYPRVELRRASPDQVEEMLALCRIEDARARKHNVQTLALSAGDGHDGLVCFGSFSVWRHPAGWDRRGADEDDGSVLLLRGPRSDSADPTDT